MYSFMYTSYIFLHEFVFQSPLPRLKFKKCNVFPAAFLILAVILSSPSPISAKEKNISPHDSIIVSAAEIDYPPFSFIDENGRADGFSVELMRRISK